MQSVDMIINSFPYRTPVLFIIRGHEIVLGLFCRGLSQNSKNMVMSARSQGYYSDMEVQGRIQYICFTTSLCSIYAPTRPGTTHFVPLGCAVQPVLNPLHHPLIQSTLPYLPMRVLCETVLKVSLKSGWTISPVDICFQSEHYFFILAFRKKNKYFYV